jgi:hypothetical protein
MGDGFFLSVPAYGLLGDGALSGAEWQRVQLKLWQLLAKRTGRYTMQESSSVSMETAQELLESICFTLRIFLSENHATQKLLETENLDELLESGQKILEAKSKAAKHLWELTCMSSPSIQNLSYRDTMQGIGGFFKRYDYRFFAHHIPCDIDYQLCHPVPDTYVGVEYLSEYLHRALTENQILHCFDLGLVKALLSSYCPDYQGLLINLCEPVITNGVGLCLIEKDPTLLQITPPDRARLMRRFDLLPELEARAVLHEAADRFCCRLNLTDPFTKNYVTNTAIDLYPRLAVVLSSGDLSGLFLSFPL